MPFNVLKLVDVQQRLDTKTLDKMCSSSTLNQRLSSASLRSTESELEETSHLALPQSFLKGDYEMFRSKKVEDEQSSFTSAIFFWTWNQLIVPALTVGATFAKETNANSSRLRRRHCTIMQHLCTVRAFLSRLPWSVPISLYFTPLWRRSLNGKISNKANSIGQMIPVSWHNDEFMLCGSPQPTHYYINVPPLAHTNFKNYFFRTKGDP